MIFMAQRLQFVLIVLVLFGLRPSLATEFEESAKVVDIGPHVTKLTTFADVSLKGVTKMAQDQQGFLWLVGKFGLMRFDGIHLLPIQITVKGKSINTAITKIALDADDNLWLVAEDVGLLYYQPLKNRFSLYQHQATDASTLSSNRIYSMQLVEDGKIWLATATGIDLFDSKTAKVERLDYLMQPMTSQAQAKTVLQVLQDSTGDVWVSVHRDGLYRYRQTKLVSHYINTPNDDSSIELSSGYKLLEDEQDNIWVGSDNILHRYESKGDHFTRFPLPRFDFSGGGRLYIESIDQDSQGNLWVSTIFNGLMFKAKDSEALRVMNHDPRYENSLNTLYFNQVFSDQSGTIWAVAPNEGLYKIDPAATQLTNFAVPKGWQVGFASFMTDSKGDTWLGSRDNLYRFDHRQQHFELMVKNVGDVSKMLELPNGDILLMQGGQGFKRYVKATGSVADFVGENGQVLNVDIPTFQSMAWAEDGSLLAGRFGPGGLFRLKPNSNEFERLLAEGTVNDVLSVDDKIIAGIRDQGLAIYDVNSKQWQELVPADRAIASVWQLVKDNQGVVWIATANAGLAKLDLTNNSFSFIDMDDGLASNDVRAMILDGNVMWLGTTKGLSRINLADNSISNFDHRHGLPIDQPLSKFMTLDSQGGLWFGAELKLSRIAIKPWLQAIYAEREQGVLLSNFKLFNQPVTIASDNSPLSQPINLTQTLALGHEDYWFSLNFATRDFRQSQSARYAYQLVGFNQEWVETSRHNAMATFTSLPAANYQLKVKTTDVNGDWQSEYRQLAITVHPPWWQTRLAYVCYVLLILLAGFAFLQYRTRALTRRANELEQGVIERTATINHLVSQKDRLIEQKDKMFANISHEFKTPLTLILNPLDNMQQGIGDKFESQVLMMKRNGQRLLRMVEQLLELSKIETTDSDERQYYSLQQTLTMLLTSFQPLFDSKKLTLEVNDYDDVVLHLKLDSLEMILTNLISNAIKYTKMSGTITVNVDNQAQQVVVSVSDTGIGIDEQNQQIVFNRFTRANEKHDENIPGAGIGLALVKELVESNSGSIKLTSELGIGSTFTVTLPVCQEADYEINQQSELMQTSQIEIESLSDVDSNKSVILANATQQHSSVLPTLVLIDDNADMLTLLVDTLADRFNCITQPNGEAGIACVRETLPDLVISDVMMPGISGFEVLKNLKSDDMTCHIPVMLLTAKGDMASRIKGWAENADEYLEKPFNGLELITRIENLLAVRSLLRHRYQREFTKLQLPAKDGNQPQADESQVKPQSQSKPQSQVSTNTERLVRTELQQPKVAKKTEDEKTLNSVNQVFFDKINDILEKHYQDEKLDVGFLASELAMSHRQLGRKMRSLLDLTPAETIRSFRLKKAAELLIQGATAGAVAYEVGFTSHSYFSQCFKAQYDCLPSAYANQTN